MRKIIAIDDTFLNGRYGDCLLCSVAQDTENHIFSIAFCGVDKECDDSCTYVFEQLRHIVPDSNKVYIILIDICLSEMAFKKFIL